MENNLNNGNTLNLVKTGGGVWIKKFTNTDKFLSYLPLNFGFSINYRH
jgi:hypothetical protein